MLFFLWIRCFLFLVLLSLFVCGLVSFCFSMIEILYVFFYVIITGLSLVIVVVQWLSCV